jgi:predicted dehydrogenase
MTKDTPNNDAGSRGPLRVGLIADSVQTGRLGPLIDACLALHLQGQAGMPQRDARPDAPWYDDVRVLLGRPELDAVLLATSPRGVLELRDALAERPLHVWQWPPLGRNFTEAAEAVKWIRRYPAVYRVASWWDYVTAHVWHELPWPDDFEATYSELRVTECGPDMAAWPSHKGTGAGGVLATTAYGMLEGLIASRGLPDSVVATVGQLRPPKRETDDTAVAILRYGGTAFALVRAAWDAGPSEQLLTHDAAEARVHITPDEVALIARDGSGGECRPLPGDFLAEELAQFAEFARSGARDRAAAPLERHLAVSATIESIYLAAQTNHPESPMKLYQVQGWPKPRL